MISGQEENYLNSVSYSIFSSTFCYQIVEVLTHIIQNNVESVHDDAPVKFWELIQLLRSARIEDLEMIWSQYRSNWAYR